MVRRILFVVTAMFGVAGCSTEPREKPNTHSASLSKKQHSFIAAISLGNIRDIKNHLAKGADPNIGAPLHVAIESQSKNRKEVVALLLARGSGVNKPNEQGWTPLELLKKTAIKSTVSQRNINNEITHLLVKYGANISSDYPIKFEFPTSHLPNKELELYTQDQSSNILLEDSRINAGIAQNRILRVLLRKNEPVYFTEEHPRRILFIGNSYTQALRAIMPALLKAQGHKATVEFITPGGAQLIKHLNTPKTVKLIENGDWDVVVFQEQSQTPACPGRLRKLFMKGASGLHKLTEENDSKMVFFNTWGYLNGDKRNFTDDTYWQMQKRLNEGYNAAANKFNAQLAPVGNAYNELKKTNPKLWTQLYQADGSHPSQTGAYLAAIVIYSRLYGVDPQKIRFNGSLNESVAAQLKSSAARTQKDGLPSF